MLEQVNIPLDMSDRRRPMINFTSYPYTEIHERHLGGNKLPQFPKNYGYQDYVSTMQHDFRAPRNYIKKPIVLANPPYMLNQKVRMLRYYIKSNRK